MKIKYGSLKPALLCAGGSFVGVVFLAACSSTSAAGSLEGSAALNQQGGAVVAAESTNSPRSQGGEPNRADVADGLGGVWGTSTSVSQARREAVTAAVADFVATLPGARLVSTQVLNEARNSSAAIAVVMREGSRQVLAVSARERDGRWVVQNVDTMPSAQDGR